MSKVSTLICPKCGVEFEALRSHKKYCSNKCARNAAQRAAYWRQNKDEFNESKRDRRRLNRFRAIQYKGGRCHDCGIDEPRVLQFDHVPEKGLKKYQISFMFGASYSWETICRELDKCDLVCANCHVLRTDARGWGIGTPKDPKYGYRPPYKRHYEKVVDHGEA